MKKQINKQYQQNSNSSLSIKKARKKAWSEEEDAFLIKLVQKYGPQKWPIISQNLPGRIGKQCRQRWYNHLSPNISKNKWTYVEQWILYLIHKQIGNKWALITKHFNGRSDNSIKNHWNSSIKKVIKTFDQRYSCIKTNVLSQNLQNWSIQNFDTLFLFLLQDKQKNQQQKLQFITHFSNTKFKPKQQIYANDSPIKIKQNNIKQQTTACKQNQSNQISQKERKIKVQRKKYIYSSNKLSDLSVFGSKNHLQCQSIQYLIPNSQSLIQIPNFDSQNFLNNLSMNCISKTSLKKINEQQSSTLSRGKQINLQNKK